MRKSRAFLRILTAFVLLAIVSVVSAEPLAPADLKSLLERIRQKRAAAPQVQANFREEKTLRMMNKPVVTSGQMWFQSPNKFRREVKGNSPSITVSNGQQLWIYYPKFQSAEQYRLGKGSPLEAGIAAITASLNLQGVEEKYNITGAQEGGDYLLHLTPKAAAMKKMVQQFTIRMNSELQLERTEALQPSGDRIVTTYSNESRAPIDAATFEFTPPAGTKITTPLGR